MFMEEISNNASHFFDINTLITTNSKVWIVDKLNPNVPILRIPKSEFNLIKKGVYKKDNSKFEISGDSHWLSKDLLNRIKIECKNRKIDISDLSFSLQEFMNKDIIENNDFTIHLENIRHLKNTSGDIYIICSKNTKNNYESIINKLESKLEELGLVVKEYYFISETFYNRDEDDINNKKVKLLLQHLIGFRTEVDKFSHTEITKYDVVYFYDDEDKVIELAKNANNVLQFLISNSEELVKERIKEVIKSSICELVINKTTFNKVNLFITTKVKIEYQNLIKKFESFLFKMNLK
jgi:hypothetical protein